MPFSTFDEHITLFYLQCGLTDTLALCVLYLFWPSIHSSLRSNNHLTYITGCKERKESTSIWILIQASRIFVFGSKRFPDHTVHRPHNKVLTPIYYSCYFVTYYHRWDYISLDHPACSIETFQKTVQWAAKPFCIQQNTVSSARRMFPCCVPAEGTVTRWIFLMIFTFTLRFPLWRGGTTCTLPDKSFLEGKGAGKLGLCLVYSLPSAVGWMDGWMAAVGNTDQS